MRWNTCKGCGGEREKNTVQELKGEEIAARHEKCMVDVRIDDVQEMGSLITVYTRNSTYAIAVVDRGLRKIAVHAKGYQRLAAPEICYFNGAIDVSFQVEFGWIRTGKGMELLSRGHLIHTTPVKRIVVSHDSRKARMLIYRARRNAIEGKGSVVPFRPAPSRP